MRHMGSINLMFLCWDGTSIARPAPKRIVSMSPAGVSLERLRSRGTGFRFAQ